MTQHRCFANNLLTASREMRAFYHRSKHFVHLLLPPNFCPTLSHSLPAAELCLFALSVSSFCRLRPVSLGWLPRTCLAFLSLSSLSFLPFLLLFTFHPGSSFFISCFPLLFHLLLSNSINMLFSNSYLNFYLLAHSLSHFTLPGLHKTKHTFTQSEVELIINLVVNNQRE